MIDFFTCLFAELSFGKTKLSLPSLEFKVDVYFLLQYDALKTSPKLSDFITTSPPFVGNPTWLQDPITGVSYRNGFLEANWGENFSGQSRAGIRWSFRAEKSQPWRLNGWNICPKMEVFENRGFSPQIIHLFIGFSIIFTIHFGFFPPIFGNTHVWRFGLVFPWICPFFSWVMAGGEPAVNTTRVSFEGWKDTPCSSASWDSLQPIKISRIGFNKHVAPVLLELAEYL